MKPSSLTITAWLSAGLHALGLLAAALWLRPGTPAMPLDERMAFLAANPCGWTMGWVAWMLCALALIAFLAALAEYLPDAPVLAWLAVVLATAGAAVDLACDTIYITVIPNLAAQGEIAKPLFVAVERGLSAVGLVVANGMYSMAVLVATLALRSRALPAYVLWLGYATFFFGMFMVGAGFTGVPWHLEFATGPTIGCFVLWTLSAAHETTRHPPHPRVIAKLTQIKE